MMEMVRSFFCSLIMKADNLSTNSWRSALVNFNHLKGCVDHLREMITVPEYFLHKYTSHLPVGKA